MLITAENLHKTFNTNNAVNGLNLSIEKGEIYGLVGSDGAGKTTTMRLLVGAMLPDEGTVTVDVALLGALPKGARPDLSVDGTIEIERLDEILYVGRPAYGQAESTIGLFRLLEDGETAVRVQVQLGKSSVNTIEIVEGLDEGDQVILSDTSAWDAYDRIRLN